MNWRRLPSIWIALAAYSVLAVTSYLVGDA